MIIGEYTKKSSQTKPKASFIKASDEEYTHKRFIRNMLFRCKSDIKNIKNNILAHYFFMRSKKAI
jgi:hypothetical protein